LCVIRFKFVQANFSQSDHSAKQRLGCADCHLVKAGAAQSKQVSSPIAAQHFSSSRAMSCMNCHNDKRAFGERSFADCKSGHTQPSFNVTC
jgi:formate-dependent nitrite reductase cytochrome c552 subunit